MVSLDRGISLVSAMEQNAGQPLAFAPVDFDEDGEPDVVSGYASEGGIVALHYGNPDALFPHNPAAQQR